MAFGHGNKELSDKEEEEEEEYGLDILDIEDDFDIYELAEEEAEYDDRMEKKYGWVGIIISIDPKTPEHEKTVENNAK